jgi:DNA-binding MarR family transcriptional regulator/N-acetylglutamate synthase-like GNAT family acetyltransferase
MANASSSEDLLTDVAVLRRFNRFYTRQAGLIEPKHLHTEVSLPEARILYELAQRERSSPAELIRELAIDAGQLSRTLQALQRRQLIARKTSGADKRQIEVTLTAKGRATFKELDKRSQVFASDTLGQLPAERRAKLVAAMSQIEQALAADGTAGSAVILRPHRPGDIGWIVSRNAALYAEEYGWTIEYEALVAEIAGQFLKSFDAARERCWIAESDGRRLGSVMLVNGGNGVAKLRLLIVEPDARGLGVGRALVTECIRIARELGYTSMTLWTQSILVAARGIYKSAGFRLVDEKPHHSFGCDLVGETWEMDL